MLKIRALTYGSDYAFAVTCESCRSRIEWELDLNDLSVRQLSDESRAAFVDGNRFETRLPDADRRVWFGLVTGADERRLDRVRKSAGDRALSALLACRVSEIEGVEPRDRREFIEDLSMGDADHLLSEFDRVDCGVETDIEVECPECFAVQDVELPFDRDFLVPGKRSKKRKSRKMRSRAHSSSCRG